MRTGVHIVETAKEILLYAIEEFGKALKLEDVMIYRNTADKAFLALIIAINEYIRVIKWVFTPRSHSERRKMFRDIGREDLRVLYSDMMRILHDEAFYEGIYQLYEVRYSIKKISEIIEVLEKEVIEKNR